jgi:hypothetical protein
MRSVRTLLHSLIDYAGLFPPAELGMTAAVASYSSYRAGEHCWALGRFVVPAVRLAEFERAAEPCLPAAGAPWRLAALAGPDLAADLAAVAEFNRRHSGRATVDTIELKAAIPQAIAAAVGAIDGRRAAGGVTADVFPPAADLLRFLQRCVEAGVPFKATAGLHHPLRGAYRLTYAPESPSAVMFGFLNVFLAAAFLEHGMGWADALALLEETSADAFRFGEEGVEWRTHRLSDAELRHTRRGSAMAFGSCSFQEPIDDLRALGLL